MASAGGPDAYRSRFGRRTRLSLAALQFTLDPDGIECLSDEDEQRSFGLERPPHGSTRDLKQVLHALHHQPRALILGVHDALVTPQPYAIALLCGVEEGIQSVQIECCRRFKNAGHDVLGVTRHRQ